MEDGLYRIEYKDICAGFVVKNGTITKSAPIVRSQHWLLRYAELLEPDMEEDAPVGAPPPAKQNGTINVRLVDGGRSKPLLNNLPEPDVEW